jgi:hypothetical protein
MFPKILSSNHPRRNPPTTATTASTTSTPLHQLKEKWRTFYTSHEHQALRLWSLVQNLDSIASSTTTSSSTSSNKRIADAGGARADTLVNALAEAKHKAHEAQRAAYLEWIAALESAGLLAVEWTDMSDDEERQLRLVLGSTPFQEEPEHSPPPLLTPSTHHHPHRTSSRSPPKPSPPTPLSSVPSSSSSSWTFVDPSSLGEEVKAFSPLFTNPTLIKTDPNSRRRPPLLSGLQIQIPHPRSTRALDPHTNTRRG